MSKFNREVNSYKMSSFCNHHTVLKICDLEKANNILITKNTNSTDNLFQ